MEVKTTQPCGCVVTVEPGHVHTKLCERHQSEVFWQLKNGSEIHFKSDNLDLIGG